MKWFLRAGVALVALTAMGAGGLIIADRLQLPASPNPAIFLAKAATYHGRIRRDEWGVPHIIGHTDADAAFALGYAQSEDDFTTLQQVTFAVRGTLAATEGRDAAKTDYLVRLFRVWETINAHYDHDLPDDLKRVLTAYADGINLYAARHQDRVTPGLLPITGQDIAAGFVFKTPFFYELDKTLLAITSPNSGNQIGKTAQNAFHITADPIEIGSNGVALSPARTSDGATRLLVNSHQPYAGPVAWYEAVLQSDEGWHVAGGFFPGTPFMLHGTNGHLGWANTVNTPNLSNVYRLKINPDNESQYYLDGAWHDFEVTDARLRVKIWGPFKIIVHRPVYWSAHGPVLKTDHGTFAIRYAGMGEWRQPLQYYRLDKAQTLTDFQQAMRLQALPSINYLYADEHGNIGYIYNGQFPNRITSADWSQILPGDRSDLIWQGYLPFEKIPQIWNPRDGLLFNSNNTPFEAGAEADNLKPADFPTSMGIQTDMTNRAYRALETFGSQPKISDQDFRADKFDISYSPHSQIAALITKLCAIDPAGDQELASAQTILRNWDRRTNVANRGAALAIMTWAPFVLAHFRHTETPEALPSLRAAIATLKTHFGRLDPTWGQLNRMRRGTLDLPIDGGPDTYRAVYGDIQPDGTMTAIAGDTLIMFVTWDAQGNFHADSIHQFGSATDNPNSKHYADQTPLFVQMKTKPVYFTEAELKPHIAQDYDPNSK